MINFTNSLRASSAARVQHCTVMRAMVEYGSARPGNSIAGNAASGAAQRWYRADMHSNGKSSTAKPSHAMVWGKA